MILDIGALNLLGREIRKMFLKRFCGTKIIKVLVNVTVTSPSLTLVVKYELIFQGRED